MKMLGAFAFCIAAVSCAQPALAAINLGELSGSRIETFSFGPGQVDTVYNFSLASAASFKVIQTDFAFGGAFTSSLSLLSSTPDPSPPTSSPPTVLSIGIEAIARIDAEEAESMQLLETYVQNGDVVAAQIQQLRLVEILQRRQNIIDLIEELLESQPVILPLLRSSAVPATMLEGVGQLGDTLAAGSYSLRLSGDATGAGFGYFTFAVSPVMSGAVPEPATWALMLAGFGLAGAAQRHRRRVGVSFG